MVIIAFIYLPCSHSNLLQQQQHSSVCCGSRRLCLSVTGQRVIHLLTPFCAERAAASTNPDARTVATPFFKRCAQVRHLQACLPVSCPIKGGTFSPFLLPPLPDPGEGCVIVCVFIFPGTRPAVGWNCVCGAGGEFFFSFFFRGVALVLGSLGRRPFAPCRGVSTAECRGGGSCGGVFSRAVG